MNQLGIAIKKTSNGAGEPIVINGGEWTRHVADIRLLLERVNGADNENHNVVRFISFTDEGCLLTVAREIDGRGGDNLAAWIFIPSDVIITGKEVVYAMDLAEQAIMAQRIDTTQIAPFFQRTYSTDKHGYSRASCGESFAYRYYSDSSLEDILGPNRYQTYYDAFRYIFLLETNGKVNLVNPDEATDLSIREIEELSLLLPVSSEAFHQHLGYELQLQLPDGRAFDRPISLKKGSSIDLKLLRDGFQPLPYPITKTSGEPCMPFPINGMDPAKLDWKMELSIQDVQVTDEKNQPIAGEKYVVKVNGIILQDGRPCLIREKDAYNVTIEINSKSSLYESVSVKRDITQKEIHIELPYRLTKKSTTIITKMGNEAQLSYQVTGFNENDSPLQGYRFNDRGGLVYSSYRPWLHRLQGFLVAAFIAFVYLIIAEMTGGNQQVTATPAEKPVKTDAQQFPAETLSPVPETETMANPESAVENSSEDLSALDEASFDTLDQTLIQADVKAIEYLDSNRVWRRSEMEQYEVLQGLFDDMNEYHLQQLIDKWSLDLGASAKIQKIAEVAAKNLRNHWQPATGSHTPFYNKSDDDAIAVMGYIYWLDKDQTKPASGPASGQQPKPASNPKSATKNTRAPAKATAGSGNKNID